jgi:transposase
MARRTKYTPDCVARIVQAIELGATYEHAANYGGIAYDTFNEWRLKKAEFSDAVKSAEGRATVGWLAKIERAANEGTWQAAAWKLERRYPHDYGRTVQETQHTGKDGAALEIRSIIVPLPATDPAALEDGE